MVKKKNKNQLKNIYLFNYRDSLKPEFIEKIEKYTSSPDSTPYSNWKKSKMVNIPNEFKKQESIYDNLISVLSEQIL